MRAISGEPSIQVLRKLYDSEIPRPIVIGGLRGEIRNGPGGFGNAAIIVDLPGPCVFIRRERESEDYGHGQDGSDPLELYDWQRMARSDYDNNRWGGIQDQSYSTLSSAMNNSRTFSDEFGDEMWERISTGDLDYDGVVEILLDRGIAQDRDQAKTMLDNSDLVF